MTEAHGVAIICERSGGHTVAWVDEDASRRVPPGYFVEQWPYYGHVYAGTLDGGYAQQEIDETMGPHTRDNRKRWWLTWRKAVAWCQYEARRRSTHNQLIAYGMLGAMVRQWKEETA